MTPNQAVLNNLGLGYLKNVMTAAVYLDGYDKLPRVEVVLAAVNVPAQPEHQLYTTQLTLRPPGFDIGTACGDAMGRIQSRIDDLAADARHRTARSFVAARYACDVPIRRHHIDAMGPLDVGSAWISIQTLSDPEERWIPTSPIDEDAPA